MLDDLNQPIHCANHGRHTISARFDRDLTERFTQRGVHEQIDIRIERGHIGHQPFKYHVSGDIQRVGELLQMRALWPITGNTQSCAVAMLAQMRERVQCNRHTLDRFQACDHAQGESVLVWTCPRPGGDRRQQRWP